MIGGGHPRFDVVNYHGDAIKTFDIANLDLQRIRELTINLGFPATSRLLSIEDVEKLWETDKPFSENLNNHQQEPNNRPYDVHTAEAEVHEAEPKVHEVEASVHEVEPLTKGKPKDEKLYSNSDL